jgi:hypothetical protein
MLASLAREAELTAAAQKASTVGLRGRRKKAAWNDDYMLQLIVGHAHA